MINHIHVIHVDIIVMWFLWIFLWTFNAFQCLSMPFNAFQCLSIWMWSIYHGHPPSPGIVAGQDRRRNSLANKMVRYGKSMAFYGHLWENPDGNLKDVWNLLIGGLEHVLFSIPYMGCHPSHWQKTISRWLLHHQPDHYFPMFHGW